MAGDWIKMRVWLAKDPRVIRMADTLAEDEYFMRWLTDPVRQSCKQSAYEHVTRNVTVALCVTGLLVTWGSAREQGDRENDDLVLDHADLITLDAMTDTTGFGHAMAAVGWVVEQENGSLRFPKFFKDNESPDEKHKRQNAERQARYREKASPKSNAEVTPISNVTVTPREEKRREEKNKGTSFLLPDWVPEPQWSAYVDMRKKAKKSPTDHAKQLVVVELEKLRATGENVAAVLDQSTMRGWTDVYPVKAKAAVAPVDAFRGMK